MFKLDYRDPVFTNWCSLKYDTEWSGMEEIDEFLSNQAVHEHATPLWSMGTLAGLQFDQERHYTMFLLKYS